MRKLFPVFAIGLTLTVGCQKVTEPNSVQDAADPTSTVVEEPRQEATDELKHAKPGTVDPAEPDIDPTVDPGVGES